MNEPNEYDDIVRPLIESDGQKNRQLAGDVNRSLSSTITQNPDEYAKYLSIYRKTGLDPDHIINNPAVKTDIDREMKLSRIGIDSLIATHPKVGEYLSDPKKAAISHDDTDSLSGISEAIGSVSRVGRIAATAFPEAAKSAYAALQDAVLMTAPVLDPISGGDVTLTVPGLATIRDIKTIAGGGKVDHFDLSRGAVTFSPRLLPENPLRRVAAGIGEIRTGQAELSKAVAGDQSKAGPIERGIGSGVQSFVQQLPAMVASVVSRNPKYMLASGGALSGGQAIDKALESGKDPYQAFIYGMQDATAEVATEMLPATRLIGDLKIGSGFTKTLVNQIVTELPTEITATVWQNFNEWANINPDKTVNQFIAEQPEAIQQTVIATLTMSALGAGGGKIIDAYANAGRNIQIAEDSERNAKSVDRIVELARASKTLSRDPQSFAQLVENLSDGTPIETVLVDPVALQQSGAADVLAQGSLRFAQDLQVAIDSGTEVSIPLSEYASKIAPTAMHDALANDLRIGADGLTRSEAAATIMDMQSDIETQIQKTVARESLNADWKASHDAVAKDIEGQLNAVGRASSAANKLNASIAAAYYSNRAIARGMTPEEFYKANPLKIVSEQIVGRVENKTLSQEARSTEIDEVSGLPLNEDGTVTVYHHTSKDAAEKIKKSGVIKSEAEPDIYFTTREEADTGYGDTSIPIRVNPNLLILDDEFPDGRKDFRIASPSKKRKVAFESDREGVLMQSPSPITAEESAFFRSQGIDATKADPAVVQKVMSDVGWKSASEENGLPVWANDRVSLSSPRDVTSAHDVFYIAPEGMRAVKYNIKDNQGRIVGDVVLELDGDWPTRLLDIGVNRENRKTGIARSVVGAILSDVGEIGVWNITDEAADWWGKTGVQVDASQMGRLTAEQFAIARSGSKDTRGVEGSVKRVYHQGKALPATLTIDGKERPTTNSKGQPIAQTEEGVRNFWRWFGDSKVVDAEGRPLVVYHGSPDLRFLNEDGAFKSEKGRYGFGKDSHAHWFTDSARTAKSYADPRRAFDYQRAEEGVIEAYIRIENPLEVNASGEAWRTAQKRGQTSNVIDEAAQAGNDGAVIRNVRDDYQTNVVKGDKPVTTYTVFSPEQIKSATGNAGTFDSANPNILAQEARGTFSPDTNTITLTPNANLSTFLHELGHHFLNLDISSNAEVLERSKSLGEYSILPEEKKLLKDQSALFDWFGIKGDIREQMTQWAALSFEEQRPYHEQFARGFESYLFEGKAPSIEMSSVFARVRQWFIDIYRDIKSLGVPLTDEVRGVFDRMLASDEQIDLAREASSMYPLFETAEQGGFTPEEFAAYRSMNDRQKQSALDELESAGLRDMKWLEGAKSRELKKLQKEARSLRASATIDARRQIMSLPVYQAWQFLTGKQEEGGPPVGKLQISEVSASPEVWDKLKSLKMLAVEGNNPDMLAGEFGFSSGDEMIQAIASAATPKEAINNLTDKLMIERHAEFSNDKAMEEAANKAIHNEARARAVRTEYNALAKMIGAPKILNEAAKAAADFMVSRLKVRELKPAIFETAAARAAKSAKKSQKQGDIQQAAAEKRNEVLNTLAARKTYETQDEIDSSLRYLRRLDSDPKLGKRLGADEAEQIGLILQKYDLSATPQKYVDAARGYTDWVVSQLNKGNEPIIPVEMLSQEELAAFERDAGRTDANGDLIYNDQQRLEMLARRIESARAKSYRDMTVTEFRGLVDMVKGIEFSAREKQRMLTAAKQETYENIRDEITSSIRTVALDKGRTAQFRQANTTGKRAKQFIKDFGAAHISVPTWARILDGGNEDGPVYQRIIRPAADRANFETTMNAQATEAMTRILAPLLNKSRKAEVVPGVFKFGDKGRPGAIGSSFTREERISVLLNMGNEGNLQRLMDGDRWTIGQLRQIISTLTKDEVLAAQAVWDYMETFKPLVAEKERRVTGKEPEWVSPSPITITVDGEDIKLRGGYYPAKYDPNATGRADQLAQQDDVKAQIAGAFNASTTRRSFTKSRVDQVKGRPLLLSLSVATNGINEVIHDLAWHEWLIDMNKLLGSSSIDAAIREHYGPEVKRQFIDWRDAIATNGRGPRVAGENAVTFIRQNVSAAGLFFNVMSALKQPFGLFQSATRIGYGNLGVGIMEYLSDRPDLATKKVNEKSEFMRNRARTQFRELNELMNKVKGQTVIDKAREVVGPWMILKVQQMVDVPTWLGAYRKALLENTDEARAVDLADRAVKESQGSGQLMDMSAILRGNAYAKLLTVFYSFQNMSLNLGYAQAMTNDKKANTVLDAFSLYVIPPILMYLFSQAMTPGDSGDDAEEAMKKLSLEISSNALGLFVIGRELSSIGKFDYKGPVGVRMIGDIYDLTKQTSQAEWDASMRRALVNSIGDFTGLPSAQINKTWQGAEALESGKTDNPAALIFGFEKKR